MQVRKKKPKQTFALSFLSAWKKIKNNVHLLLSAVHFPDFDIDRMLYECWVNDESLSE